MSAKSRIGDAPLRITRQLQIAPRYRGKMLPRQQSVAQVPVPCFGMLVIQFMASSCPADKARPSSGDQLDRPVDTS